MPVTAEEEDERRLAAPRVEHVAERDVVSDRLVHLGAAELEHPVVHPDPRERPADRRDWAISFSWCGKTRSSPPPWISNSGPSAFSAIAEHSMCQPGRPRPHGESHDVSSPAFVAFQSAKSRGSSLSAFGSCSSTWSGPLAREPAVLREPRDTEVHVAVDRVGVARRDELLDQRDDLGDRLGRERHRRRASRARGHPCPRGTRRSRARRARRCAPGAAS